MPIRLTIDRMEENWAVCEDAERTMRELPLSLLPEGVREGDCLLLDESGNISLDTETAEENRRRAKALMERLFKK